MSKTEDMESYALDLFPAQKRSRLTLPRPPASLELDGAKTDPPKSLSGAGAEQNFARADPFKRPPTLAQPRR